jgi:hypothetical protein
LVATAQNKVSSDGVTVAAGTLAANANKTYLITSQRDLAQTFGVPFFYNTTTGTPINGYELNEYGLLAAYSALGVSNRCYVQRADVDLTALTASLTRPTGTAANGTYWVDTGLSTWGIFEWNATTQTFELITPTVITDVTDVVGGSGSPIANYTPLTTVGAIGDYAVVAIDQYIFAYYKNSSNAWVQLGSEAWKISYPTVAGTNSVSGSIGTAGDNFNINGTTVTLGATNTVAGLATVISNASITGVSASSVNNQLYIYATSAAGTDGSTLSSDGFIEIGLPPGGGTNTQALLTTLGIALSQYPAPQYLPSYSYEQPKWISGQDPLLARPTGSVWHNMSTANNGLNVVVKQYSAALGTFITQSCPAYSGDGTALYGLDPTGGGKNIPAGTTYIGWNQYQYTTTIPTAALTVYERYAFGATVITGTTTPTSFTVGDQFTLNATQPGTTTNTIATVTIGGTGTVSNFIQAVSAANVPYVTASVNSVGNIVFTHSAGGTLFLKNNPNGTNSGPNLVTRAGFAIGAPDQVTDQPTDSTYIRMSNFVTSPLFTYSPSSTAPDQDPADGRLWYYSAVDAADIMIQDDGSWQGYQNVTNDARGYNLTDCNATGPIIAATAPTTQTDTALSPLVYGDLWIDTSDLENYPKLYRWQAVSGVEQWVEIDTTDQTTQNGILFADARWSTNGTTDPIADPLPSIVDLLTSDYLDPDAPNPALLKFNSFHICQFNTKTLNLTNTQSKWITTTSSSSI